MAAWRRVAFGAAGCCGVFTGYRFAYVNAAGAHKPAPVKVKFLLDLSTDQCFRVICNPRLLDETTPPWFRLIIRSRSQQAVDDFLREVDEQALAAGDRTQNVELPVYLSYWMLAFGIPFPWTSKVTHCGKYEIEAKSETPELFYCLTYEQHVGPFFGGFRHCHVVKVAENGCQGSTVEDTIDFDVTSEPIVNTLTWYVLDWLLRGRCKALNGKHGGAMLT